MTTGPEILLKPTSPLALPPVFVNSPMQVAQQISGALTMGTHKSEKVYK
jgi:hypothetical protein